MANTVGAKARLQAAVKRLETAIDLASERTETETTEAESLQQELNTLNSDLTKSQTENEQLSEQLLRAKSEYASAQNAMDKISTRLDNAIDTVQALLEEQPGTQ